MKLVGEEKFTLGGRDTPSPGLHVDVWGNDCWRKMELSRRGKNNEKEGKEIVNEWSENAPEEVQKSKLFLPRARGHPSAWISHTRRGKCCLGKMETE